MLQAKREKRQRNGIRYIFTIPPGKEKQYVQNVIKTKKRRQT